MKYKHKLLLLLAWVLVVNAYGQMQQSKWFNFQPSGSSPTCVNFSTGAVTTASLPSNSLTEYRGYNAVSDEKGNLVFYIIAQNSAALVYNGSGVLMATITFTDYVAPVEIPIIKVGCGLVYHFIIGSKLYSYDVMSETITDLIATTGNSLDFGFVKVVHKPSNSLVSNSIAVTRISDSKYNVYSLNASNATDKTLCHYIVNNDDIMALNTNATASFVPVDITNFSSLFLGANWNFDNFVSVMEVSADKKFIAFVSGHSVLVYNLNTNGSVGSSKGVFRFDNTIDARLKVAGLEFSSDSKKLYFTRFDAYGGTLNDALGYIDLSLSTPIITYISGTDNYANSEIELGRDANLYLTTSTQLIKLNTATNTLSSSLNLNFYKSSAIPSVAASSNLGIRVLPDQIDGVDNSNGFAMSFKFYTPLANTTWNTTTTLPFPTSNGQINIAKTLTVNAPLLITGMTLNFMEGARINIVAGGILTLRGCTLKGIDCGKMWNGISVTSGGLLVINDNFIISYSNGLPINVTPPSKIYDAIIAINVAGNSNNAIKVYQTEFERNEQHISIDNCKSYPFTRIEHNTFGHKQPLKDQTRGVYDDMNNLKYGKTSVGISNVGGVNTIELDYCTFNGGQLGVSVYRNPVIIKNSNFNLMVNSSGTGVRVNQKNSGKNIEVTNCKFTTVQQAFVATNCNKNILFTFNKVDYTTKNAVDIYACKNANITVKNNEFAYCSDNAIILTNNAGQTTADISLNTITGDGVYGPGTKRVWVGVSVIETGKPLGTNTYNGTKILNFSSVDGLQVTKNTMNKMSYGIKMNGLVGAQRNIHSPDKQTNMELNTINYISTYTKVPPIALSDRNTGIQMYYSDGITTVENTIQVNSSMNTLWRNRGVHAEWNTRTLIAKNTIKAGRGISSMCMGTGNNYNCNTFNQNYDAISLGDHWMRSTGDVHGVKNILSRDNTFNSTSNYNIELYAVANSSKTAQQQMNDIIPANQWVFTTVPPRINITPKPTVALTTIVDPARGSSICTDLQSPPGGTSVAPATTNPFIINDVMHWQWQYNYVREQKQQGIAQTGFINDLIDIQNHVSNGSYDSADVSWNALEPDHIAEINFKNVYRVAIDLQWPEARELTEQEVVLLTKIAAARPQDAGPAVYIARGLMWYYKSIDFDTDENKNEPIGLKLTYEACLDTLPIEAIQPFILTSEGEQLNEAIVGLDELGNLFLSPAYFQYFAADLSFAFRVNYNGNIITSNFYTLEQWMQTGIDEHIDLCALNKRGSKATVTNSLHKEQLNDISIYPNPTSGLFTISGLGETSKTYHASVCDVYGKTIYDATLKGTKIDLQGIADGLYYITIQDMAGNVIGRKTVVKQ